MALNFVQTYRSHRVAERLRDAVAPTATALRSGTWTEIRRRDLVPGDIVRLAAGDRVPADAHLLEARDLRVQQAALTGESMPAEKDAANLEVAPRQPAAILVGRGQGRGLRQPLSLKPVELGRREFVVAITRGARVRSPCVNTYSPQACQVTPGPSSIAKLIRPFA